MLSSERRACATLGLVVSLLSMSANGRADAPAPGTQATNVAASARQAPERAELDSWAARLTSADPAAREAALAATDQVSGRLLPVISERLAELERSSSRAAVASLLFTLRPTPGAARPAAAPRDRGVDGLATLLRVAQPTDRTWRDAVVTLGLCRMLGRVGTLAAVRELIGVVDHFGDALRAPVEQEMRGLGERAVAALIEARRSDNRRLRPWALRLLDALGKSVPGEAVQTSDNQVLADVLGAYGRTKDGEAARVVVSFANSDRAVVREAARQAVTAMGEAALFQLRDAYENATGKKPPDAWTWERVRGELFTSYDEVRLNTAATFMEQGFAAQRAGDLAGMAAAFDRALARAPDFERSREMVPGYITYARSLPAAERPRALLTLRRVARLDPAGPHASAVLSLVAYLEAEELAARGVVDRSAYQRAVDLDATNSAAARALARVDALAPTGTGTKLRAVFAVLLMSLAAISVALSTFGRRLLGRRVLAR